MSVLYFEGFETCADETDVVYRGWDLDQTASLSGQNVLPLPARNGVANTIGLMLRGPYTTASLTYAPNSGNPDFGLKDLGQSIYSLWQAGGFSIGFNATFNKTIQLQVAPSNPQQIRYDGSTYYWAICLNAATYVVCYSSDLQNWIQCPTQPTNIAQQSTITISGSGSSATVIVSNSMNSLANAIYYTTNMGLTWTTSAAITNPKYLIATGNSAAPFILPYSSGTGLGVGLLSSALAFTAISATQLVATGANSTGAAKLVNGVVMTWGTTGTALTTINGAVNTYFSWIQANNSGIATAANWTAGSSLPGFQIADMTYINGYWVAVGYGGIYIATQSGTVGNVLGPTAAWSNVVQVASAAVFSCDVNTAGTVAVAVGHDAVTNASAIYYTNNGTSWTKVDRFLFQEPSAVQNNTFTNVFWDGHRFVLTGGLNNNVIAVSTDGIAWNALYYPDYTEAAGTTSGNVAGVYSGTLTAGTYLDTTSSTSNAGSFVPWSTATTAGFASGLGFTVGAATQGLNVITRTVQGIALAGATTGMTLTNVANAAQNIPCTGNLTNYYEIIATAVPGTTNQFTVQYAINGVVLPGTQTAQFAATTDTTGASRLLFNLPQTGNFVMIDDIYLTNFAGTIGVGQLGPQVVMPLALAGDVSDQLTNSINGNTNAKTVNTPLSNSEGYVYSSTPGVKDTYSTSNTVPASYKINAVQVEGFFAAYGPIGANCQIQMSSNGQVVAGNTVAANSATPLFSAALSQVDPNTGAAWTAAGLNALNVVANKIN
jgi:hypothetical protein